MTRPAVAILLFLVALATACQSGFDAPPTATTHQPIIGGEVDELHPAVGTVLMPGASCSGTLISPRAVLTAAHCVHEEAPPEQFLIGHIKGAPEHVLPVAQAIAHPQYDPLQATPDGGAPHDIALLILGEAAPVAPMAFVTDSIDCLEGTPIRYVGFGLTNVEDGSSSGSKFTMETHIATLVPNGFWSKTMPGDPHNACSGDSGGAALLTAGGKTRVIGVISLADKYCEWQTFCVRTDIHAAWLYGLIESHDPDGLPSVCGDGDCQYLEDEEDCPEDCAPGDVQPGFPCSEEEQCSANHVCAAFTEETVCGLPCADPEGGTGCPCGHACRPYPVDETTTAGACQAIPEAPDANCGDAQCSEGETEFWCPVDCPAPTCQPGVPECCGNGLCEAGEDMDICPSDCLYPGFCGDGECNGTESYTSCPEDCKSDLCDVLPEVGCCMGSVNVWCFLGDLQMISCDHHPACGWNPGEAAYTCGTDGEADPDGVYAMDCEAYPATWCGDGICNKDEDFESCPADCEEPDPDCGDGVCGPGEDYATCVADCYESGCGNIGREGCCEGDLVQWCEFGGLFKVNCTDQGPCGWSAEDGYYWCDTEGEADPSGMHPLTCQEVADAFCGDGICNLEENKVTCPEDCVTEPTTECGNGTCEEGEDPLSCPADCPADVPDVRDETDLSTADLPRAETAGGDADSGSVDGGQSSGKSGGGGCRVGDDSVPGALVLLGLLGLLLAALRRRFFAR